MCLLIEDILMWFNGKEIAWLYSMHSLRTDSILLELCITQYVEYSHAQIFFFVNFLPSSVTLNIYSQILLNSIKFKCTSKFANEHILLSDYSFTSNLSLLLFPSYSRITCIIQFTNNYSYYSFYSTNVCTIVNYRCYAWNT